MIFLHCKYTGYVLFMLTSFSLGWLLTWTSSKCQLDSCADKLQQPQYKMLGVHVLDRVFWRR